MGQSSRARPQLVLASVLLLLPVLGVAEDLRGHLLGIAMTPALGGATTRPLSTGEAFTFVAGNASQGSREAFSRGNELFNRTWGPAPGEDPAADGLGPVFNRSACSDCHVNNGRGQPPAEHDGEAESILVRISVPGASLKYDAPGMPRPVPGYGDQLQDRAVAGVPSEGRLRISWTELAGEYGDGTPFSLRHPNIQITDLAFGPLPEDTRYSLRVANPMIGLGLLEMVPDETLYALADRFDRDGDGISGVVNWVWSPRDQTMAVGRFGWKANTPNITSQTTGAAQADMGITSDVQSLDNCLPEQAACTAAAVHQGVEMSADLVRDLNVYSRRLAVPAQRNTQRARVRQGFATFSAIGCSQCHMPTLITGSDPRAADLSEQIIHPFTDLLLHDMGDGLADGRRDFGASSREWRTAPLWGIGLTEKVGGHRTFLHDGRARSLSEAILWHAGEAETAKEAFRNMAAPRRAQLIAFLGSL